MRRYYPHFMDAEYATSLGSHRATSMVDHNLKLLALLGARISIGDTMIVDSEGVQRLIANRHFRRFVMQKDSSFLRLEVAKNPQVTDRDSIARQGWRRLVEPGWVSSSSIGTAAMVKAASVALRTGFDDDGIAYI